MNERRFFERHLPEYAKLWKKSNWVTDYKGNDEGDFKTGQAYIHRTATQNEIVFHFHGLRTSHGFQSTYGELIFEPLPMPDLKSLMQTKKEPAAKWKFRIANSEAHEIIELPYRFGDSIFTLLTKHARIIRLYERRKDMTHPEYRCFCRTCMVYKRCNSQNICRACGDILEEKSQ